MKTIETHLVEYNTDNVFYTSSRLLHMFAAYSDIPNTEHWTHSFPTLKEVIDEKQSTQII